METLLFLANSAALGVGLAMDAFSVSLANGLHEPHMRRRRMCGIASVYAFFQYAMPMLGWVCVHTIVEMFSAVARFVPWIAFFLLLWIGGKMLFEGLEERKNGAPKDAPPALSRRLLLLQGIATSIDALSVGFTIAEYGPGAANLCGLVIAAVTFIICFAGLEIGKKAGTRLAWRASILGGCILIGIGIEILVKSFL